MTPLRWALAALAALIVAAPTAWAEDSPMPDEIAWKLFGVSMAAYNFLLSLVAGLGVLLFALRGRHAV